MPGTGVSIVIPTYGRAEYLAALVDSVRKSTPKGAYEIVVVSSDPPESDKVKWLATQPDVVFIPADARRGGHRKRSLSYYTNLGIRRAKKEWIFVLNDDMSFAPDWYAKFAALAADPKNADVGMVIVASHISFGEMGLRIPVIGRIKKRGEDWKDLFLSDFCLIRKDAFAKIGLFDEKIEWCQIGSDTALGLEFLTDQRTLLAPEIKIDHFIAKENRDTNDGLRTFFKDANYVLAKWRKWCRRNGCDFQLDVQVPPYTLANRFKFFLITSPLYTRMPEPLKKAAHKIKRSMFNRGRG